MPTQHCDNETYTGLKSSSILDPATPIKSLKGSELQNAAFSGFESKRVMSLACFAWAKEKKCLTSN